MGRHAAGAESPSDGGIGKHSTVLPGGEFQDLLAAFTIFNHMMAVAAIKLATPFFHEETFNTFFYGFTNHGYHILSLYYNDAPKKIPPVRDGMRLCIGHAYMPERPDDVKKK